MINLLYPSWLWRMTIAACIGLFSYPVIMLIRGYTIELTTGYYYAGFSLYAACAHAWMIEWHLFKNRRLRNKLSWLDHTWLRFLIELPLAFLIGATGVFIGLSALMLSFFEAYNFSLTLWSFYLTLGILMSLVYSAFFHVAELLHAWQSAKVRAAEMEQASVRAQMAALQNQVSPHFLFNSLNMAHALIDRDTEEAKSFIDQLAEVYRYVLKNRQEELVSVQEEIEFARHYLALAQMRFQYILIKESVSPDALQRAIPPVTLQILIENALHHNAITHEHPLHLYIESTDNSLILRNTRNPRLHAPDHSHAGTGLNNIRQRYLFFTERAIQINQTDAMFSVTIPLLEFPA